MRRLALLAAAAILLVISYGAWIEPDRVEINHIYPANPTLKGALSGKTAVHISDLHLASFDSQAAKLLEILKELKPDFVFLTGDYVPWNGDYEPALAFLARLEASVGVWAVMGDYDYSSDRKSCLFCHEPGSGLPTKKHPVRFLRNSIERASFEGADLQIVGVENESDQRESESPESRPYRSIPEGSIVLSHSPLVFDELADDKSVLVLAGDTHGGQVWLPKWLWSLMGYEKNARYGWGWFEKGSNRMHVSRGLGTSHVRFRLMCRPEVVVVHF
jgi:hypothetical protein